MNKKLLILIPMAGVIGLTLMSNSNENFKKYHVDGIDAVMSNGAVIASSTGAPGESNCTQCHSGTVLATNATNGMTTLANSYQVDQTYSFAIASTNATNGFQMTILDNDGNKAGSFVAGAANTAIQSSGGKEYINHNTKTQAWAIEWTAPASDMGPLTAYYSLNVTNDNNATSGDMVYVGTHSLASDVTNGLTNYQLQDEEVNMFFNANAEELNVKYSLKEKSNIMVQIVDLSGKVIEEVKLGQKSFGPHASKIQLENIKIEGIYIVSLFINNGIYSRKINLK
jgi:hypothetical protein